MGIVEFLNARLDEDDQAAREASVFYDDHDAWENGVAWRGHEGVTADRYTRFWLVPHLGVINDVASGRHIVRHNPKRVLAEVKAKRHIVTICNNMRHGSDPDGEVLAHETLCGLAAVYADHPDYDPAWKIEQ